MVSSKSRILLLSIFIWISLWQKAISAATVDVYNEASGNNATGRTEAETLDDIWTGTFSNGTFSPDLFQGGAGLSGTKSFTDSNGAVYQVDWQTGYVNDLGPGTPTSRTFVDASSGSNFYGTSNSIQGDAPNPFPTETRLSMGPKSNGGLNAIQLDFSNSAAAITDFGIFVGDLESRPNNGTIGRVLVFDLSGNLIKDEPIIYTGTVLNGTNYTVVEPSGSPTGVANNDSGDWGNDTTAFISVSASQPIGKVVIHVGDDDHTSLNTGTSEQMGLVGFQLPNSVLDYGDAPEDLSSIDASLNPAYPTTDANNGAKHTIDNATYLGSGVDAENDGQPSFNADTDNDDGVSFPAAGTKSILIVDQDNTITVEASTAGVLNAWIDWNQDGDWDDTDEQIATNQALTTGSNSLSVNPNNTVSQGQTYARFRFSSQADLEPTGTASNGEVEDYAVNLVLSESTFCDVGLINGGFESPLVGQASRLSGGTNTFSIYREAEVEGWSFFATNPNASSGFDQRNSIEFWNSGFQGVPAFEGNQFAEINAFVFGSIYQDFVSTPGSIMRWRFAHRGRQGDDTIQVNIGAPGTTVSQGQFTTGKNGWQIYSGIYTIPPGQNITRISFEAVSTAGNNISVGNFVDAISFGDSTSPGADCFKPSLLLVKRITAINRGQVNEISFDTFVDDSNTINDNDPNWPDNDNVYLPGVINVANIEPGDEIEYTIYFLANGDIDTRNISICDVVPDDMTFVQNTFDSQVGIGLGLDGTILPAIANLELSNLIGDDEGNFYSPGSNLPQNLCKKTDPNDSNSLIAVNSGSENINGAIIVNIDTLPVATAPGFPTNSYGFIRFRARVK